MKNLVLNNERFKHLDPLVTNIVNDVTKSGLNIKPNEKGEVDMCVAIAEMKEDSKAEGLVEGRTEGLAEGRVEGRAEGRTEGENIVMALMQKLLSAGRYDDAKRVTEDPDYKKKLMKEFALL